MKKLLKKSGRPPTIRDGRNTNVYMDAETLNRAKQIGAGNVSAGIRKAVGQYKGESDDIQQGAQRRHV